MSVGMFTSKTAKHGFLVLFLGFVLIFVAGIYIFTVFVDLNNLTVTPQQVSREVYRSIRLAKALPINTLASHLKQLEGQTLKVSLSTKPLENSRVMYTVVPSSLMSIVRTDFSNLQISVPLANGQWLNIERKTLQNPWFSAGFMVSLIVILFSMVLLCYLIVKRLAVPLFEFTDAAKRFGTDLHAPPIAVSGTQEMREAVQAFNAMQKRIRRMVHDRTQMLAAVSHDLRAPITRLQLRLEYFKERQEHYQKAVADLKIMEEMISSILSFARDSSRTEPMERFDMNALLESLCDDLADMDLNISYQSSVSRLIYFGRLNSMRRVFTNLINNAIKYGKVADVRLAFVNHEAQVRIDDVGPGIPESDMEKVFDPFYRVDPARRPEAGGTGLGLTVAREIVRSHGGEIDLLNRKTGGLTVLIHLPVVGK
ncbi:MAG: HAMP domain-containing protein [Coxiellaceae bacterium]|nr:HAMP domain-containing protein [Coxiellaceae bacterium]